MSEKIDALLAQWQNDKDNLPLTAELINTLFTDTTDWQRSEDIFQQMPELIRNRAEVFARHIEFLLYHKQFEMAVAEAKLLCEVTENHHMSLHYWALTNFLTGQYQKVADLANQPKLIPETKVIVARVLQRQDAFEKAANLIADTKSAEGLGLLSLLRLDLGQFDEAFATSQQALSLKADQVDALQTKASLLVGEQNMVRGGKIIRQVLKLKPNSGRMLALQGEVEFFSLQIPPAIKSLEKTLKLMPDHIGSLHFLGWCYCMAGEFDVAVMTFKKALALDANFAESQGALAVIEVLRNDLETAAKLAKEVLDKAPQCASANYAVELITEKTGDNSEAQPTTIAAQGFGQRIIAVVKQFKQ
jgi:tetratricopeptide (TPR) repeat protein